MVSLAILVFLVVGFLIVVAINALGFKISCGLFGRNISFLEAVIILIIATVVGFIYALVIFIPSMFILTFLSMAKYIIIFGNIAYIVGIVAFFKYLKNYLNVGWINIILIYIVGNIINTLIFAGIALVLYLLLMWFGGMSHVAGHAISSQLPYNNIKSI